MINESDLEALFHPSLPNFNTQPYDASTAAHVVIEVEHINTDCNEIASPLRGAQLDIEQGGLDLAFRARGARQGG
jgi:hypothetical protein